MLTQPERYGLLVEGSITRLGLCPLISVIIFTYDFDGFKIFFFREVFPKKIFKKKFSKNFLKIFFEKVPGEKTFLPGGPKLLFAHRLICGYITACQQHTNADNHNKYCHNNCICNKLARTSGNDFGGNDFGGNRFSGNDFSGNCFNGNPRMSNTS